MRPNEMLQAAVDRADVVVTRDGKTKTGTLLFWSSKQGRAKVILSSGAVITVATDTVALRDEVNFVADENRDDAKYRNFRGLRTDSDGPSDRNEGVSPVRSVVEGAQPWLGCGTDVSHHVA